MIQSHKKILIGNDSYGGTPSNISNLEVKPINAESTWGAAPWEDRKLPIFFLFFVKKIKKREIKKYKINLKTLLTKNNSCGIIIFVQRETPRNTKQKDINNRIEKIVRSYENNSQK